MVPHISYMPLFLYVFIHLSNFPVLLHQLSHTQLLYLVFAKLPFCPNVAGNTMFIILLPASAAEAQ